MRYQDRTGCPSRWSGSVTAGLLDSQPDGQSRYMPQRGDSAATASTAAPPGLISARRFTGAIIQYSPFDSGRGASQSIFICLQTYLFRAPASTALKTDARTDVPPAPLFLTPSALPGSLWPVDERMLPPYSSGVCPKSAALRTVMHRLPSARMAAFCTRPGCRRGLLRTPT